MYVEKAGSVASTVSTMVSAPAKQIRESEKKDTAVTVSKAEIKQPASAIELSTEGKKDVSSLNEHNIALDEKAMQDNDKIKKVIEKLNVQLPNSEVKFGIHDKTDRVTIKIVDKNTKEVIKEFPPEKTLDMIAKCMELAGVLMDERL